MGQAEAELASGCSLGSEFSDACWSKMIAQPSESDFQRCPIPQVWFVPVAVMPQSSRGRSWGGLWEGAVTLLEGPHSSLWWTHYLLQLGKGAHLLGRYFNCHPIPSCCLSSAKKTLGLTLADLFLFRHLGDSAWEGFCSFIRKHEIRALIFLFSVRCWKQDLKCQNNQVKNRDPKCVTHLRY